MALLLMSAESEFAVVVAELGVVASEESACGSAAVSSLLLLLLKGCGSAFEGDDCCTNVLLPVSKKTIFVRYVPTRKKRSDTVNYN